MSLPGQGDHAAAEQAGADFGEPGPDVVVPADCPRPGGQIEYPLRGRGEDSRFTQRHLEPLQVTGAHFDIGIEINARERQCGLITCGESRTLGGNRNRQNADSGLK